MSKLKVVFLISTLKKLGPVMVLKNIIHAMDLTQFEITIITFKNYPVNSIHQELKLAANIINLQGNLLAVALQIRNLLRNISAEVVHSHGIEADFLNVICTPNTAKTVNTTHTYVLEEYKVAFGNFKGYLFGHLHGWLLKRLDCPIACSKSVSDYLNQVFRLKTTHIRNGLSESISAAELSYTFLAAKLVYVYSGKLIKNKQVNRVIAGFVASNLDGYLVIIGDGPLLKTYQQQYQANSRIIFTGLLVNPLNILNYAKFYVSASLFEGLSMAIIEAMSLAKPVLLSNIPSHRELLELDQAKKFGYAFSDDDQLIELFKQTADLSDDAYRLLSQNAQACYLEHLTANKMSLDYQKIYRPKANKLNQLREV